MKTTGYRDGFELKLRDQTQATKRKASAASDKDTPTFTIDSYSPISQIEASRPAKKNTNMFSSIGPGIDPNSFKPSSFNYHSLIEANSLMLTVPDTGIELLERAKLIIPRQFSPPIDQRATCYFLFNFVLLPQGQTSKGNLDFIIPSVFGEPTETTLNLALNAVAYVAFANQPNARKLLPLADSKYVTVLNQINKDLQDAEKAKQDSTLAAVFLLSFYEQLSSHTMSLSGWLSHIDGAVALVQARGKSQLDTKIGRSLFDAVRTHMTVECISSSRYIKEDVDWWMSFASEDKVQHEVSVLNLKVANLRAESHQICTLEAHTTENLERVLNHLREAELIEKQYVEWYDNLPPEWTPRVMAWIDDIAEKYLESATCYPGRVDSYVELWMATTHNIARASRLFILTTVSRCTAWLSSGVDYRLTPEYIDIWRQASLLIDDIISSVPFFFGWNTEDDLPVVENSYFPCGNESKIGGKGVTGIWAMWPVFAAAASDFATNSQRLWLRGRLKYIAEDLGIRQAEALLQVPTRYPSTFIYRDQTIIEDVKRVKMVSMAVNGAQEQNTEVAV
ncbi:hypothetical protein DID88_000322 [Monilinia fructigena]|uniref:Transcription factor domain-containing protein n=1 Tax=Monilinia fructigena TaxID=38457 RepID=A0A395IMT0_9HELO|nr:hypothetical protein DID88_000322 [Monilinia fructigena]